MSQNFWTEHWENLGGNPLSGPAVSSWGLGQLNVFWRGQENHLKHKWFPYYGGWSGEQDLGGNLASAPAAISWGPGRIDVFWQDPLGRLKHKWYPHANDWTTGEEDLGGGLASAPAACSWEPGRIDLFWRGADNRLKHKWFPHNGQWSYEEDLGGVLISEPAAVSWGPGRIDVFWQSSDSKLKHKWFPHNGQWSYEEDMGGLSGLIFSAPSVCSRGSGKLDVFWKGMDTHLWHIWYPLNNAWSNQEDLGGNLSSAPDAVSWGPERIDVFGRAFDGKRIEHKAWGASPWHNNPPLPISTVLGDTKIFNGSDIWEFSMAVVPPGSVNAPKGRVFMSGSVNKAAPVLYQLDLGAAINNNNPVEIFASRIMADPTKSGLLPNDGVGNDNTMTRRANGEIMLVRALVRTNGTPPIKRSGLMVWVSSDSGETWVSRTYVDPASKLFFKGKFSAIQWNGDQGGFDRNEVYADPWTNWVNITANAAGATNSMLVVWSKEGDAVWSASEIATGVRTQPVMMSSLPGMLVIVQGWAGALVVRWTADPAWFTSLPDKDKPVTSPHAGVPAYQGAVVYWNDGSGIPHPGAYDDTAKKWIKFPSANAKSTLVEQGQDGSIGISRIGRYINDKGIGVGVFRVMYGSVLDNDSRQVLRVISVSIPEKGTDIQFENIRTIEASDSKSSVVQATMIQADAAQVGLDVPENTALIYWKELSPAINGKSTARIRGIVTRDILGWSPVFDISEPWESARKQTGDYIKGGFYFDKQKNDLCFVIQWIREDIAPNESLHVKVISVPR